MLLLVFCFNLHRTATHVCSQARRCSRPLVFDPSFFCQIRVSLLTWYRVFMVSGFCYFLVTLDQRRVQPYGGDGRAWGCCCTTRCLQRNERSLCTILSGNLINVPFLCTLQHLQFCCSFLLQVVGRQWLKIVIPAVYCAVVTTAGRLIDCGSKHSKSNMDFYMMYRTNMPDEVRRYLSLGRWGTYVYCCT